MTRWDAARARSRETPRKYVECGPVGSKHMLLACAHLSMRVRVLKDDFTCAGCGYHVCGCYDWVTWLDGSKHRCTCSGRGGLAYVIEDHCTGHPPIIGSCERHGMKWREGQECWLCKNDREDAERRASLCNGCSLKRGHRSDCPVLHTALAQGIRTGDFSAFEPPKEGP